MGRPDAPAKENVYHLEKENEDSQKDNMPLFL
jgi:hypothetical protein